MITTSYGLSVDFASAPSDTDDREVLLLLCERALIRLSLETKEIFVKHLKRIYVKLTMCVYYRRGVKIKKHNIPTISEVTQSKKTTHRNDYQSTDRPVQYFTDKRQDTLEFRTRLSNKFAGFTLGVFLNQCLGRSLMALKDVVYA